jgi:hypothetical protein
MHTYKAQVKVTSIIVSTLIAADSAYSARIMLAKLYGSSNVINVQQVG